jgi:hypothetical protein
MYDEMAVIFGHDQTSDNLPSEWTDHDDIKFAHMSIVKVNLLVTI